MVAMYSVRDYCDMYLMYGRCNGNALRTAREYARRYPSRRPPDVNVIRQTAKYGKRLANSQSSRYWKTAERPDGSTGGCNTAAGRRDARGQSACNSAAKHQERWSLNVWAGILGDRLLGPYLLPERLSGQSYLVFLNEVLTEFLDDIPLAAIQGLWFQHDGAPTHFCAPVRGWLDMQYPGRWIERGGLVLWPPRSPDLAPLDFFLWGHLKELVYRDVVTTQMDLVARLHAACTSVDPSMLQRVMTAIPRRAQACLDMYGRHFEHLL
ncbi:hypothetical protein AVEN_255173-1 [Araneus ventricosus]|uniref:DUF4817 domain-containing protein n=1 Tax=Araneus ventricosus TaxID=182803 RepID=A0A4Y2B9I9_ARAVE|nr:hypothetical protein AVEN_255173-1 [Araneus ventricosus]